MTIRYPGITANAFKPCFCKHKDILTYDGGSDGERLEAVRRAAETRRGSDGAIRRAHRTIDGHRQVDVDACEARTGIRGGHPSTYRSHLINGIKIALLVLLPSSDLSSFDVKLCKALPKAPTRNYLQPCPLANLSPPFHLS